VAAGTYPCKHTDTLLVREGDLYGTLYRNVAAATAYWDLFSTGYVRNPNAAPTTEDPACDHSGRARDDTAAEQPSGTTFSRAYRHRSPLERLRHDAHKQRNVTSPIYVMEISV